MTYSSGNKIFSLPFSVGFFDKKKFNFPKLKYFLKDVTGHEKNKTVPTHFDSRRAEDIWWSHPGSEPPTYDLTDPRFEP